VSRLGDQIQSLDHRFHLSKHIWFARTTKEVTSKSSNKGMLLKQKIAKTACGRFRYLLRGKYLPVFLQQKMATKNSFPVHRFHFKLRLFGFSPNH
jgi:hypothetical protein